jgi:hypothetical protein
VVHRIATHSRDVLAQTDAARPSTNEAWVRSLIKQCASTRLGETRPDVTHGYPSNGGRNLV